MSARKSNPLFTRHKTRWPGITYRVKKDGSRRYAYYHAGSHVTVDGGEKDARDAQAKARDKAARGERIVPSKVTLGEYVETWLDTQMHLRPRTRDWYDIAIKRHIVPRLGKRKLAAVTEDDVVRLIAEMRAAGYAAWTIRGVLTPLGRIFVTAVRGGLVASNPVRKLERGERPRADRREMRVLTRDEIGKLLDKMPAIYRTLVALSVFTGLRQGEALGLTWADVDVDAASLRVRKQLGRDGVRVEPKTPQAIRDVTLMPSLVRILREHKERAFAAGRAKPEDFVFASRIGTALHYRNVVRRGLDKAVEDAKLNAGGKPKLRWHDLRHTAASLLIAEGLNVVYVSRQLGHASPDITLRVYSHLFDQAEHAERANAALEASFANVLAR